ncbi:MAG: 2-oxoacid:acceptor oxidoreductase family protein [Pseudomonadota bacterium]
MIEIRFHGRGGQGAVTSAELIALAAIEQGKYAQSMPAFGPERRGAPVQAYLRVSDKPIRIRAEILEPDVVVVLDESLLEVANAVSGLKNGGLLVVNTTASPDEIRKRVGWKGKVATVDALTIAMETLRVPITNTTLIGAMIKAKEIVPLATIEAPVKHRFNEKIAARNITAMKQAYEKTQIG